MHAGLEQHEPALQRLVHHTRGQCRRGNLRVGIIDELASRSRISRERGPGISVRIEIARVAATRARLLGAPYGRRVMLRRMDERDLDPDPIVALRAWIGDAEGVSARPDAMTLATSSPEGRPSARVVLLRGLDRRGLAFFTNRSSRKGRELEQNPHAALVLHWPELGRQVRIEGAVEPVSENESRAYWETRPHASRLAAWASPQSQPLDGRAELDALYADAATRFGDEEVPLPGFWGGYRVVPASVEFWEHRENRLHDRIRYERVDSGWRRGRLAP